MVFSWYFLLLCQHPYTIATYSHYDHRRRHIISCFCSVFNWNICLCRCQEYNVKLSVGKEGVCIFRVFRIVSDFEHMYVVTWSDSKLVHNYNLMIFQWASSFTRFLDHIQRHTTFGRTPLDEWSARRRDLYLTTHNTHNRQTSIPWLESKPQSQQATQILLFSIEHVNIKVISHSLQYHSY